MPRSLALKKRPGFRLVDLLVAVLLVGLFGGVLAASVANVRAAQHRAQSNNNLKMLALATISCADTYQGQLPSAVGNFFPGYRLAPGAGYGPILFHLLPYLEQDNLYKSSLVLIGQPLYAAWTGAGKAVKLPLFAAGDPTADATSDRTSYLANGLAFPFTGGRFPASFSDGTSNTIFYAEAYSKATGTLAQGGKTYTWAVDRRWWDDPTWAPALSAVNFQLAPAPELASARLPQGFSPRGIQVGMADGSVHLVGPGCSAQTFYFVCTPAGGEILGSDW